MFSGYFGSFDEARPANYKKFTLALGVFEACGAVSVILTVIWLNAYLGGFSWSDESKVFNYHPLFMLMGMVFLYGNGELVGEGGGGCLKLCSQP